MRKLILSFALATSALSAIAAGSAYAAVPCEDLRAQLETAMQTAKPADADKAKFDDLVSRAEERCVAEDDRRSGEFFTQALALLPATAVITTDAATSAVMPASSVSALGDLSAYNVIFEDTLESVEAGDMAAAETRIADAETLWDQSADTLKAVDKTAWRVVDVELDAVLSELRAATPDQTNSVDALNALIKTING